MTPNEKKALVKFGKVKQGNTVTIAGTLGVTINYAWDTCKKLCDQGYLERLSPGKFALYKITLLGKKQVGSNGSEIPIPAEVSDVAGEQDREATEQNEEVPSSESESGKDEWIEEYECTSCGTPVKEDDTECAKCGAILEGCEEEPVSPASEEPATPAQDKPSEDAPQPSDSPTPEGNKKDDTADSPSAPEDWKACNWKWK